ncbi:nucleotidyltransferase family protein [Micromonospora sp. CPCC 205539]|uniref:nucleotidyltransferase family protein n=1 Tax=Micromonospora sp. CPCC 205539 TaxID=3122408 RepID=UPI002FF1FEF1
MTALPDAVRCLSLDTAAATVTAALAERGVEAILLKGAGLARRLGQERHRVYTDIDLLVAPASFDLAQRSLTDLGCRSALPEGGPDHRSHWYERPWRLPGPLSLTVDLHRGFHGVSDPETLWTVLSASAERIALAGGTVAVPDEAGTALLVALHAAAPGLSDRPRADLSRALAVFPADTWRAAADLAAQVGAIPSYALGLRLAPAGATLAATLGLPRRGPVALWLRAHRASPVALTMAQLAELPTLRDRLRHLGPRLLPTAASMRHASPLARRGPAGLLLAHLARLVRNAGRLPAALAEVRAARRSDRG